MKPEDCEYCEGECTEDMCAECEHRVWLPTEPGVYRHLENGRRVYYQLSKIKNGERMLAKAFWKAYKWLDEIGEGQWERVDEEEP